LDAEVDMLRVLLMAAVLGVPAGPEPQAEAAAPVETSGPVEASTNDAEEGSYDPNYSRLLFAPTGRPLRRGDGYISDHELVFPGFAVGLTDNVSLAGGVSVLPGLGLTEQVAYFSPSVGFDLSDRAAVSLGALVVSAPADLGSAGIVFGVGTFGSRDHSLSVGLGLARELGRWHGEAEPILMVGGQTRLSKSIALVSENWIVLDGDTGLGQQPFGLALRFFGERLSADLGFIFVGEALEEGFPVPWVSVSYHFKGVDRRARRP
jgi:hypothetical protein